MLYRTKDNGKRKMKKRYKILLTILAVLIAARIALPYIVLHFANKKLAEMDGYYGHIDDVDISLYRGAYQIKKIFLKKVDKKDTVNFIDIKLVDLAIEWKPIFNGEIVGKVLIDSSAVLFTREKNDISDVAKDTADFRNVLNSFMPITLNKLEIKNSFIKYNDPISTPKLNMAITNLNVVALNLANGYDSSQVLPATITASANVYEGNLKLNVKLDPFAKQPKFDMDARLERTNMVKLNDFLRAYANIDVNKGRFGLYTEVAAKNGKFDGYVKPLITDLDIVEWTKEEGNFLQIAYETLVGTAAWILKNHRKDQLATKVYLSGDLDNPKVSVGRAILTVLQNAFIAALKPTIDREINLNSVNNVKDEKTVFDKLLKSKEERKADKKERKAEKAKKKKAKEKEKKKK